MAAACLAALCNTPGSGVISRGRGDAPLTWTDPSSREGAAFKDEALNPSHLPAADQARMEGLSAAAPEVADTPAPDCTRTTWPWPASFYAVSGVTASWWQK